jgi:hypothetical protein
VSREALGHADNRPRIHVWPHSLVADFRFSFGPLGCRSRQGFKSVAAAVEAAEMHNGGFSKGAVIIIEPHP